MPMPILSRLFVIVGHVAIRQLVHLDTYVFSEIKRRNHLREQHEEEKKKNKKEKNKRKSLATSASEASMGRGNSSQEGKNIFISHYICIKLSSQNINRYKFQA